MPKRAKQSQHTSPRAQHQYTATPMFPTPPPVYPDPVRSHPNSRPLGSPRTVVFEDVNLFNDQCGPQEDDPTVDEKDVGLLKIYLTGKFNIK